MLQAEESLILESAQYVREIQERRDRIHRTLLRGTNPGEKLRRMLSYRYTIRRPLLRDTNPGKKLRRMLSYRYTIRRTLLRGTNPGEKLMRMLSYRYTIRRTLLRGTNPGEKLRRMFTAQLQVYNPQDSTRGATTPGRSLGVIIPLLTYVYRNSEIVLADFKTS